MRYNKSREKMKYTIKDDVAEICIPRNGVYHTVLVDAIDLDKFLEMGKWYISMPGTCKYVEKRLSSKQFEEINEDRRKRNLPELKVTTLMLHRYLLDLDCEDTYTSPVIDHIDGNGLNNCRSNLRLCDRSQNSCNKKLRSNSSTGYKGVAYRYSSYVRKDGTPTPSKKPWTAYIKPKNSKRITIGYYETAEEAAKAYDEKAKELFGQFARLNNV
jgi:hypothetical protein